MSVSNTLNWLMSEKEPIEIGAWDSEAVDRAREAIDCSRANFG